MASFIMAKKPAKILQDYLMLKEKIQYKKLERVTTAEGRKYVGDDGIPFQV